MPGRTVRKLHNFPYMHVERKALDQICQLYKFYTNFLFLINLFFLLIIEINLISVIYASNCVSINLNKKTKINKLTKQ